MSFRQSLPKIALISRSKDRLHASFEHDAEASRKPPFSRYFFRFSRSFLGRLKSASPVMMTNGMRNNSSSASFTALKRRSVAIDVFCCTVVRNSSLKHFEVRVPA